MFARVTTFQTSVNSIGVLIENFKEKIIPELKLEKGYRNSFLLTDRETGKCISIALWDSKEDAIADEESGEYEKRILMGKDRYTGLQFHSLYEVVVQD
jgi:hypothetical protein